MGVIGRRGYYSGDCSLIENALAFIREVLATAANPAVAWSSGKDSQVILWLVRQVRPDIPLIFFRNADDPVRFQFADAFLAESGLTVHSPAFQFCDVVSNNGQMELLTFRNLAPESPLMCGIGIDKEPKRCGLTVLNRRVPQKDLDFDLVFMGHRSDDVCPIQGEIPLAEKTAHLKNCILAYPIKDWTETDVWDCIEREQLPLDPLRYDLANRREWEDKSHNPDYDSLCVNCLNPSLGERVPCLLTGTTDSIAHILNPEQRARDYRAVIANLL